MDGALLGASETTYVGSAMVINSLTVLAIMVLITQCISHSLAGVWCSIKLLTVGRIVASFLRFRSGRGPLKLNPRSQCLVQANQLAAQAG